MSIRKGQGGFSIQRNTAEFIPLGEKILPPCGSGAPFQTSKRASHLEQRESGAVSGIVVNIFIDKGQ